MPAGPLTVGIVPLPAFTMVAFAGFVDALRLAADDGDRSRPIRCRWTVMSDGRTPVRASNGVTIGVDEDFGRPERFDCIAVVGGVMHDGPHETPALIDFLRAADAAGTALIGLCTGSFTLARAGLMRDRTACVNWFHHAEYEAQFPGHRVVSDRLFLEDKGRVTCAGGISVVHVAGLVIDRHLGRGAADAGRRILLEERTDAARAVQPAPALPTQFAVEDARVRRALLHMDRHLAEGTCIESAALAARGSRRTLQRAFNRALGASPHRVLQSLRVTRAQQLLEASELSLRQVAHDCGFADESHLVKVFKAVTGQTTREWLRLRNSS